MTTYRIRGWDDNYETYESRRLKTLLWVAMPTKHDGKTFRRVMRLDPTGSLYGAWALIVQVAAKCPVRGTLADGDGPLTALDIADKTDLSTEAVQHALNVFSSSAIRWLETDSPADSAGVPARFAGTPAYREDTTDITEQDTTDITEQDKDTTPHNKRCGDAAAVQVVVDSWNKIEGVRHVRGIAGKRGTAIKTRLSKSGWRDNWQAALERVSRSSFCKGGGDQGWVADLDWFVKPDTLTKIMEGKYDDRASNPSKRSNNIPGPGQRYTPGVELGEL